MRKRERERERGGMEKEMEEGSQAKNKSPHLHPCSLLQCLLRSFLGCFGLQNHVSDPALKFVYS